MRAERSAPTSPEEAQELDSLVQRVYEAPEPSGADIPTHDLEEFYLVASWFRKHPPERVALGPPLSAPPLRP